MTLMDHGISVSHPVARPPAIGQTFEVRWSSLRHDEHSSQNQMVRCELALRVQVINREHALVEAWVETPTSRKQIQDRQPMRIVLESDERFAHIDVIDEHQSPYPGARLAAMSIPHSSPANGMYAQTSLLRKAGFAAGTHDRPRMLRIAINEADAATA